MSKCEETMTLQQTTVNLLDYSYHQNYYKLIGTDLSSHTNPTIPQ